MIVFIKVQPARDAGRCHISGCTTNVSKLGRIIGKVFQVHIENIKLPLCKRHFQQLRRAFALEPDMLVRASEASKPARSKHPSPNT